MTESNTEKSASDRGHEAYSDDAQAIRVLSVDGSGTASGVALLKGHPDVNDNASTTWARTRADTQPDSETVTLSGGDSYKRTFTYGTTGVENNVLVSRTSWILQ